MIPALTPMAGSPWPVLPPGVHSASLDEVEQSFATNAWRRRLFRGLIDAAVLLRTAGCPYIFLDGSYITGKPRPGDFDACWDPTGVIVDRLDKVFLTFADGRAAQKARFGGEFFPSSLLCVDVGQAFVEFFQTDRFTGQRKGIVSIALAADPRATGKVQP